MMKRRYKSILFVTLLLIIVALAAVYLRNANIPVLQPRGVVGDKERQLMFTALLLSIIVVLPVFVLTFMIVWRYRAGNKKATYSPNLDGNRILETTWWLIPSLIIVVLSVLAWRSSHELDPYRALKSSAQPVTIQVVALDWKWLFIYPDQHIASVNFVQFPANTPVNFQITADAPMNSFWIPQLGGQVYAMSGMQTQLHLMADKNGDYRGSSANISGKGFAGMTFTARASSQADFNTWVTAAQHSTNTLDQTAYDTLAKPSQNNLRTTYALTDQTLYNDIVMKYMMPSDTRPADQMDMDMHDMSMNGMDMKHMEMHQ
jgi:cytochrome o ubiquinol oxidase subunit 2